MANIFFIGATGHIGGAVIDGLLSKNSNLSITALFRSPDKAMRYQERFPAVKTVIGDLEDLYTIEEQSRAAAIVINTAPDLYMRVTDAVARGLSSRPTRGFYIHTAGAALIWEQPCGESSPMIWDDIADIDAIKNRPEGTTHKDTDSRVRSYASTMNVAIISPAYVHGLSPSPNHPTFLTLPDVVSTMRAFDSGFVIGKGANRETFVHVVDLARMYVALVDDALCGPDEYDPRLWGVDAYYFGGDIEMSFRDFMELFVPLAKESGIITTDEIKSLAVGDPTEAAQYRNDRDIHEWSDHIITMFGINMRCQSARARELLGYEPKEKNVAKSLSESLDAFLKGAASSG
ncbi:NAD(P)-binding protein [Pleurostoma richardsiae]|uniref:NAD(P)-binding protein n=1 Tax=Pleurostoma richardsiae TaxID=41990 RepID=A0AA38R3J3_9PEZI|nr:NAD(P)-binding protein [Pleurostoma richardsiae]